MPANTPTSQVIIPTLLNDTFDGSQRALIDKAFLKLLRGEHHGDLELLKPSRLYAMRLNQVSRILLKRCVLNHISTWVLVECLWKHEYDVAHSLLCSPMKRHEDIQKIIANGLVFIEQEGALVSPAALALAPRQQLIEYGDAYIEASDAQHLALQHKAHGVLDIVYGEAGSGKTLVLMQRIATLAHILASDESATRNIWVIVPYVSLQRHLEQEWQAQAVCQQIEALQRPNPVRIVTPDMFYRRLDALDDGVVSKDAGEFIDWLIRSPAQRPRSLRPLSNEQLYRELCLFHGLMVLKKTQALAEEAYQTAEFNAVFLRVADGKQAAQELSALWQAYQQHLARHHYLDALLYQPRQAYSTTDYFFCDEAQNLSPSMLNIPWCFIAMNDSQSILFPRRTNEIFLKHLHEQHLSLAELPHTHRCPKQVVQLACAVDEFVAQHVNPRRKHAVTTSPLKTTVRQEGMVCVLESHDETELDVLKQVVCEPDTAVVYFSDEVEREWRARGISALCAFTPNNPILGLEFKKVILVAPLVFPFPLNQPDALLPYQVVEQERCWNTVQSAMTRSTEALVLVQQNTHHTAKLLDFFKSKVVVTPLQAMKLPADERAQLLFEQATRLYQEGQHHMALKIIEYLGQDTSDFLRRMAPVPAPQAPHIAPPARSPQRSQPTALAAAAATTEAVTVQPINLIPLSRKLVEFLEGVAANPSQKNLETLLSHKSTAGHEAMMLLCHPLSNDCCLLLNLFFTNRLQGLAAILKDSNSEAARKLNEIFNIIGSDEYELRLALHELNPQHPLAMGLPALRKKVGFEALFTGRTSAQLNLMIEYFINKLDAVQCITKTTRADGIVYSSFLEILLSLRHPDVLKNFLKRKAEELSKSLPHWTQFLHHLCQYETLSMLMLWTDIEPQRITKNHKLAMLEVIKNQERGLFLLAALSKTKQGQRMLFTDWEYFKVLLSTEKIFFPIENGMRRERLTPFIVLYASDDSRVLLTRYWDDFRPHLTTERLFQPITADDPDQRETSFSLLCSTDRGMYFLVNYWTDFRLHLTAERLFSPLQTEGPHQGFSPFLWLCASIAGRDLLSQHWADFRPHLDTKGLSQCCNREFAYQGSNPFFYLFSTDSGITLLTEHWADFSPHLTADALFSPITAEGPLQGLTSFYSLCSSECGVHLLTEHWDDFRPHLTTERLFSPMQTKGPHQGSSPFLWLCGSIAGSNLLTKHWSDFRLHLDTEGLSRCCMGEQPPKGLNPFYCLFLNNSGLTLLTKHWDDFRSHLTAEALFSSITADGDFQGKTAFHLLMKTHMGRALLKRCPDEVKRRMKIEGFHDEPSIVAGSFFAQEQQLPPHTSSPGDRCALFMSY